MASLSLSLLHSLSSLPHKTQNPKPQTFSLTLKPHSFSSKPLSCACSSSYVVTHKDLNERDWSFVEPSSELPKQRLSQVITSAALPPSSHVLIALPTARFVDALLGPGEDAEAVYEAAEPPVPEVDPEQLPEEVVAYHESLLVLSYVKESHDEVRCFQGDVSIITPDFAPFDAIFVCYFPGMGISVNELLKSHVPLCTSGTKLVIFFDQGRETVEKIHRQNVPEMVGRDLPDLKSLKKAASANSYEIVEFIDEPKALYLAVLKFCNSMEFAIFH